MALKRETNLITQDHLPGTYIEPEWSKEEVISKSPFYAVRILLATKTTEAPKGHQDYISFMVDGQEYVLHKNNYYDSYDIANIIVESYLRPRGFKVDTLKETQKIFRSCPDKLIECIVFGLKKSKLMHDIPRDKSRIFGVVPDIGACGYYRSRLPLSYLSTKEDYYVENKEFTNPASLDWFDAFLVHRSPPEQWLGVFQNLHNAGKVLIYETDDDIFNIPDWNSNKVNFTDKVLDNARTAIDICDMAFVSTKNLCSGFEDHMPTFHCPNLISKSEYPQMMIVSNHANKELQLYEVKPLDGKFLYYYKPTKEHLGELPIPYNPITILWAGSATHDMDLKPIVDPIIEITKTYGLAVRFVFFGYCPSEFLEMDAGYGHEEKKLVVKDCYAGNITYINGVELREYNNVIRSIKPSLALLPLQDNQFNRCKSNIKWLEMGGHGIPCIASKVAPYEDCIQNNIDGILVENSSFAWKTAIETMINQPDKRGRIGENARNRIFKEFSWEEDSENRQKWDNAFAFAHQQIQKNKEEHGIDIPA